MDAEVLAAERRDDSMVITIHGDLDMVTSPLLDACLAEVQDSQDRIILDLSDVDFLDTTALAVIVSHWKKLQARGGMLALAGARYRYAKTLWITGLATKLTLYETVDEGVLAQARAEGEPSS